MPTITRPMRYTEQDIDLIAKLAHAWGPVKPLDRTAVIREALRRAWKAEESKKEKAK